MKKVYIASRWKSQKRLRRVAEQLKNHRGVEVTSRWIYVDRPEDPTPEFFKKYGFERAAAEIEEILRADTLVLDLLDGRGRRGGMMFEAGCAYALKLDVVIIGDPDCVFTQLFKCYPTWEDFLNA